MELQSGGGLDGCISICPKLVRPLEFYNGQQAEKEDDHPPETTKKYTVH